MKQHILRALSLALLCTLGMQVGQLQGHVDKNAVACIMQLGQKHKLLDNLDLEICEKAYAGKQLDEQEQAYLSHICDRVLENARHDMRDDQLHAVHAGMKRSMRDGLREPKPDASIDSELVDEAESTAYIPRDIVIRSIGSIVAGQAVQFNSDIDLQNFTISNANLSAPGISSLSSADNVIITYDRDGSDGDKFEVNTGTGPTAVLQADDTDVSILNRPLNVNESDIRGVENVDAGSTNDVINLRNNAGTSVLSIDGATTTVNANANNISNIGTNGTDLAGTGGIFNSVMQVRRNTSFGVTFGSTASPETVTFDPTSASATRIDTSSSNTLFNNSNNSYVVPADGIYYVVVGATVSTDATAGDRQFIISNNNAATPTPTSTTGEASERNAIVTDEVSTQAYYAFSRILTLTAGDEISFAYLGPDSASDSLEDASLTVMRLA